MRSRDSRRAIELALRAVALVALVAWIANALRPRVGASETLRIERLPDALPRITASARTDSVHVRLDTVPDVRRRDWLGALGAAGIGVSWSGTPRVVGVETFAAGGPAGGTIVLAAAPDAAVLGDALGPIDTVEIGTGPAAVRIGDARGDITLMSGAQPARAAIALAPSARRVLVAGTAGWEAKFIVAALEEAGWAVDAHVRIGPSDVVGGARIPAPDTARHAAVVLVDSGGAAVRDLDRYVRHGGGLVLAGDANRLRGVSSLVTWRAGARETAPLGTVPGDTLWRGLGRVPLDTTAAAVVIERRGGHPVLLARRHYAGRVVAVGYDETWRWRMAGGEGSVAAHREWWSRIVGSVAFRPASRVDAITGAAPVAALYAALGAPAETRASLAGALPPRLVSNVLGALLFASLLAEWLLRRARGAR